MQELSEVAGRFFPQHAILAVHPFGTGNINDTYRVQVRPHVHGREAFLMQRINHEVFKNPRQVMANIRQVYEHLSQYDDMPCLLQPLPLPDGELLLADAAGNYWRMFPFFEGMQSPERVENPDQAFQASASVGRFLARLIDLDPGTFYHTIPDFHNSLIRFDYFCQQVELDPVGRLKEVEAEVEEVMQGKSVFEEVRDLALPERVVHNDTKVSNVLFETATGKACGLIDWDTIMPGSILSDFGDMVRSFVSPVEEDAADLDRVGIRLPIFRALCRGFVPPLEGKARPEELDNLVLGALWITLEQAMRFLADYLAGDPYYKVAYPQHNLVRTRNQLILFRELRRRRLDLEDILREFRST